MPDSRQMEALRNAAIAVAEHSYSPYSHFRVGAALLLANGETVTGTNVENVSYGLTLCAERSALVRAVAQFGPDLRIAAVAVVNRNGAPSPPCGACRQVLAEFVLPDAPVSFPVAGIREGEIATETMAFRDLLPWAFAMDLKQSTPSRQSNA